MSGHYTIKPQRVQVEFRTLEQATAKGGVFAIQALAQEFGLWEKVRARAELDPRKVKGKGYDPAVYVAAFLFGFASGGASMADFERLNDEGALKKMLGIKRFPDEASLGQWLRAVGADGQAVLWRINRDFVEWALKRINPGRLLHGGDLELFFDDTQLEVTGTCFEGAKLNYDGNLTLGWQTLWAGPFLVEGVLGEGSRDCSGDMPGLLERNRVLWQGRRSYLYADSGSSAGKYLEAIAGAVDSYSVSYNKWTGGLERCAGELPEQVWSAPQTIRWRDGKLHTAQHAWLRYQPEGCEAPQLFAVTRHQLEQGELFWRYAFILCDAQRGGQPGLAIERHKLKGDKERLFSHLLSDMDLHHPPCKSLHANGLFYALGALAYNLLVGLKLLHMPDDEQPLRIRTLLHTLMLMPVHIKMHARRLKAQCSVSTKWLPWWEGFLRTMNVTSIYQMTTS